MELERYSVSLISQGKHRFYSLTMPSDILSTTCFVSRRDEDPLEGFQRLLDKERAEQIASYIDAGFGTIPCSIILSSQKEAELKYDSTKKTIQFKREPKAFLILDGQHRVYGFSKAKSKLRVPVVIYDGLSRSDECRLFIDINTKQRPVSNELLLDIKKLAETETDSEKLFGQVFDLLNSSPTSPLLGLMSPSDRIKGKISRVTFYAALKPIFYVFENSESQKVADILGQYLNSCINFLNEVGAEGTIVNSTVFRAFMLLFPEIAQITKDRYQNSFTYENFKDVLAPIFQKVRPKTFTKPTMKYKELSEYLSVKLRKQFSLS